MPTSLQTQEFRAAKKGGMRLNGNCTYNYIYWTRASGRAHSLHLGSCNSQPLGSALTLALQSHKNSHASGGDKRPRRLPVSALSPSNPVDKMPAYCEKNRLIPLPNPDTHETQLSNCSHTNNTKSCYVFGEFCGSPFADKYRNISLQLRCVDPATKQRT